MQQNMETHTDFADPLDAMRWRYAVKRFDPLFTLSELQRSRIKECIRLTPSSMGIQPYRVIWIEDAAVRQDLRELSHGQSQVTDASAYLIFACGDLLGKGWVDDHADLVQDLRKTDPEKTAAYYERYKLQLGRQPESERLAWAARQAYIALGSLLAFCAQEGLDACPLEGFDAQAYDLLLRLQDQGLHSTVAIAIGRRHDDDKYQYLPKVRRPAEELILSGRTFTGE